MVKSFNDESASGEKEERWRTYDERRIPSQHWYVVFEFVSLLQLLSAVR